MWWKRWWVIAIAAVVVLIIIAAIAGGGDDEDGGDAAVSATTETPTETDAPAATGAPAATEAPVVTEAATTTEAPTTTEAATTTTEATTTTTAPSAPPIVFEGSGDQVIPIGQTIADPQILLATNGGSSNFQVYALNDALEQEDLLVNEIGPITSRNLVEASSPFTYLEISAEGDWRLEFVQLETAISTGFIQTWDGAAPLAGAGNDVVLYSGGLGILQYSNTGDSNFQIYGYSDSGSDLLVNEIGPIEGTGRITAGPLLLDIGADGDWTLTVQPV